MIRPVFWSVVAYLCLIELAYSQWDPVKQADDGSYYVSVDSDRFTNSSFIVYAYPQYSCSMMAGNIFFQETPITSAEQDDVPIRLRIDSNPVVYASASGSVQTGANGSLIRYFFVVEEHFLKQLVNGSKLLFDDNVSDNSMKTDSFSLQGSSKAISNLINTCQEQGEWGTVADDEWSS